MVLVWKNVVMGSGFQFIIDEGLRSEKVMKNMEWVTLN